MLDTLDNTALEMGLDIINYSGKWKEAKRLAFSTDKRDYQEGELTAFNVACRLFLELGGERVKPSLDNILRELLGEFTLGTVGNPIRLTKVVTVFDIRKIFRKYGIEYSLFPNSE